MISFSHTPTALCSTTPQPVHERKVNAPVNFHRTTRTLVMNMAFFQ
ncbi:hypothetical protein BIFCAT_01296 [Bifidobacterium catenulatum DSM 16992 = JCM 1194 = LMG 11043]|uniref:Uncharacterized protein n=1 Tax=Bifidobacterium catenulatum DSM 16992 = JCM 1194 = LMG 11043 TaxID=566552 RepID=B6XW10_9BIFI|nr:hypothetical protein BIFCAT_01296 [Bifidobacterium catenulatum DSM 16992 = JCM 1194 = LMG 11043]